MPASKAIAPKSKATLLKEAADAFLAAADAAAQAPAKKKAGRPAKAAAAVEESGAPAKVGAKRGRKPKPSEAAPSEDIDMSDIEADLVGEPEAATATVSATGEKVKPLRMKISKAKERALMKEFGLDDTVLSEEDLAKRRQRLKALIKLGKTRGYLTHPEIKDHLPDKLVDAETLEVVFSLLNDMSVAVYESTPDAETLFADNITSSLTSEEEAEEEAEAAVTTVDSEFGRTTDPVRMYMREMGTVELLTREGEIRIAKRIEEGLEAVKISLANYPGTYDLLLRHYETFKGGQMRLVDIIVGFIDPNAPDEIAQP
ncbi:MAG: hypothetical protein RL682_453, partial [Pseudomonadota bacterium]